MSTAPEPEEALAQAVSQKQSVSIIAADGSVPRPIEAQFIGPARPGDPGALWLQSSARAAAAVKAWSIAKTRISVRFNVGGIGAGLETTVIKYVLDYWLTDRLAIPAILLAEPSKIWLEQRNTPRYQPRNDGGGIRAKLSRQEPRPVPAVPVPVSTSSGGPSTGARQAPRPSPGPEARATLWDLGLGGASFICPFGRPQTLEGASFEVILQFGGKQAVIPVRMAYARTQGNLLRIGVEFKRAEASPEANAFLETVVADLAERTARWEKRGA